MNYFFKIAFKCVELFLRALTSFRYLAQTDRTKLLLEHQSSQQKSAFSAWTKRQALHTESTRKKECRILIVIPFRDRSDLTGKCIDSLLLQNIQGLKIRIALIDNGSSEQNTQLWLASLEKKFASTLFEYKIARSDVPFNFSYLNNLGVNLNADWNPDFLYFLNNDVELLDSKSLQTLVHFAEDNPEAGAIGCTLLYQNRSIQHLFLAPGVKLAGAHLMRGQAFNPAHAWYQAPRPVAAVTGASLLVRTLDFLSVQKFDENLATSCQDLDLCLKLQKLGKTNWTLSSVTMIHYENATRTKAICIPEYLYLYQKWGNFLTRNPYFSSKISRWSEKPTLAFGEGDYPWRKMLKI